MKEKREYSRSIRMTNKIKELIENQEGKSFNDKFENIVMLCISKVDEIDNQIKGKEKKLNEINKKIVKRENVIYDIDDMKRNIEQVINKAKRITENDTM